MRVLITGITGFVGSHLADSLCAKRGVQIFGISRTLPKNRGERFLSPDKIHLQTCDSTDSVALNRLFSRVKPERVFHLAAQASVPVSWKSPRETFEQNFVGTMNVLEAVRKSKTCRELHIAGSAQEYGIPPQGVFRIDEKTPINPRSPYAVSKVLQDMMASQYALHYPLKIVRTRGFNHIGSRQTQEYLTSSLARQIARIEAGLQPPLIEVGNMDTIRDYTDVRDMVEAYWLALEHGKSGEVYNVCSGRGLTVGRIVEIFLQLTPIEIKIKQDPKRMRLDDLPRLVGNPKKFTRVASWHPKIDIRQSLKDLLAHWREEVRKGHR